MEYEDQGDIGKVELTALKLKALKGRIAYVNYNKTQAKRGWTDEPPWNVHLNLVCETRAELFLLLTILSN